MPTRTAVLGLPDPGQIAQPHTGVAHPELSIVVPFKDEQGTLQSLVDRIRGVLDGRGISFEVILVDDGSRDGSWEAALTAAAADPRVHALRHRRNFGKAAALRSGITAAEGRVVVTMDADLQDDPAELPRFLAEVDAGFDVVSGWKSVRHDPVGKTAPSKLFNAIARRVSGIELHDFNCGFKAYTRDAAAAITPHLYGDMHRYLPVIAGSRGFCVSEIEVRHHPREHGVSKYGASRMLAGACDLLTVVLLTRFGTRPMHLFGGAALLVLAFAAAAAVLLSVGGAVSAGIYTAVTALLAAAVLTSAGLVCELVVSATGVATRTVGVVERVGHTDRSDVRHELRRRGLHPLSDAATGR